jgi:hypothetical protein
VSGDLLIKHVRPMGGPATDVLVRDGRIAALGAAIRAFFDDDFTTDVALQLVA